MNCLRGMQPRDHEIMLTDHAWKRFKERSDKQIGRKKLKELLQDKLNAALGRGLSMDDTGAAWLEITPELWATVRLGIAGWVIPTIIRRGERAAG